MNPRYSKDMQQRARLTSRDQIIIPLDVRRALGLQQGDQVVFEIEDDNIASARRRRATELVSFDRLDAKIVGLGVSRVQPAP